MHLQIFVVNVLYLCARAYGTATHTPSPTATPRGALRVLVTVLMSMLPVIIGITPGAAVVHLVHTYTQTLQGDNTDWRGDKEF